MKGLMSTAAPIVGKFHLGVEGFAQSNLLGAQFLSARMPSHTRPMEFKRNLNLSALRNDKGLNHGQELYDLQRRNMREVGCLAGRKMLADEKLESESIDDPLDRFPVCHANLNAKIKAAVSVGSFCRGGADSNVAFSVKNSCHIGQGSRVHSNDYIKPKALSSQAGVTTRGCGIPPIIPPRAPEHSKSVRYSLSCAGMRRSADKEPHGNTLAEALNISPADVISASQWSIKQAAVAVTINGLEELQNSGEEQIIDLFDARVDVAESSIENLVANGIYSDGTGTSGKQITGLQAMVVASPATGTVGGIDRGTWSFWRNQTFDFSSALSLSANATTIGTGFNTLYASCARGSDVPDLIMLDNAFWGFYEASLQNLQRFPGDAAMANQGFVTTKYMNADVVLDGGIGGNMPTHTGYFLNTKYLFYRPHRARNFVPIGDDRMSTNQDAIVRLIGWAGNMTSSGLQFQGIMVE